MDKPNIVLNIIEKNENNDKVENNNNQKQNSKKEKSSNNENLNNIDKNYNDTTTHLSNEQKKKLQSWIDYEEESKIVKYMFKKYNQLKSRGLTKIKRMKQLKKLLKI